MQNRTSGRAADASVHPPKTWARTRPNASKKATQAQSTRLARNLRRDPRFHELTATDRLVLLVAAFEHANSEGAFFVKQQTLADEAGVSRKAVNDAVRRARALEVIVQEHYLRPMRRGEGASNYAFAADIVFPGVTDGDTPLDVVDASAVTDCHISQAVTGRGTCHGVTAGDTVLNGEMNEHRSNVSPTSFGSMGGGDLTVAASSDEDDDDFWRWFDDLPVSTRLGDPTSCVDDAEADFQVPADVAAAERRERAKREYAEREQARQLADELDQAA